jgi:hypothetical protein
MSISAEGELRDYAGVRERLGMPVTPRPRMRLDLIRDAEPELPPREDLLDCWGAPLNMYGSPSPKFIVKLIATKHEMTVAELLGPRRGRALVAARDEALGLVYTHCRALSLHQLGELFGGRDHTTILHALRKMRMRGENWYRRRNGHGGFVRTPPTMQEAANA